MNKLFVKNIHFCLPLEGSEWKVNNAFSTLGLHEKKAEPALTREER